MTLTWAMSNIFIFVYNIDVSRTIYSIHESLFKQYFNSCVGLLVLLVINFVGIAYSLLKSVISYFDLKCCGAIAECMWSETCLILQLSKT